MVRFRGNRARTHRTGGSRNGTGTRGRGGPRTSEGKTRPRGEMEERGRKRRGWKRGRRRRTDDGGTRNANQGTPRLVIKLKMPPDGTQAQGTAVDEVDAWLHKGRSDGNESASSSDTSTPPTSERREEPSQDELDSAETVSEDVVELVDEATTLAPGPAKRRKVEAQEQDEGDTRPLMPLELVWAKVPSYPWWPAQIAEPQEHQRKVRHKKNDYFVVFYGENNWAWMDRNQLVPYTENYAKHSANKNKGLQNAIQLANQSIVR